VPVNKYQLKFREYIFSKYRGILYWECLYQLYLITVDLCEAKQDTVHITSPGGRIKGFKLSARISCLQYSLEKEKVEWIFCRTYLRIEGRFYLFVGIKTKSRLLTIESSIRSVEYSCSLEQTRPFLDDYATLHFSVKNIAGFSSFHRHSSDREWIAIYNTKCLVGTNLEIFHSIRLSNGRTLQQQHKSSLPININ